MHLQQVLVIISSLSFLAYGITYFTSSKMKNEFIRFGLSRLGIISSILQILGALGLLVGLVYNFILPIASGGLTLMMFVGVAVRLKIKDSVFIMLPALFFLFLNLYIFCASIKPFLD